MQNIKEKTRDQKEGYTYENIKTAVALNKSSAPKVRKIIRSVRQPSLEA